MDLFVFIGLGSAGPGHFLETAHQDTTEGEWLKQLEQLRHCSVVCRLSDSNFRLILWIYPDSGNCQGAVTKVHCIFRFSSSLFIGLSSHSHCISGWNFVITWEFQRAVYYCLWFVPLCHGWGKSLSGFTKQRTCWNTASTQSLQQTWFLQQ